MQTHIQTRHLWMPLLSTIEQAGFDVEDFEVEGLEPARLTEDESSVSLLTLRRRSNGRQGLYLVSPGEPWLFSAFADLVEGRFGRAAPLRAAGSARSVSPKIEPDG